MSAEKFRNFRETGPRLLCNRKQQDLTYMLPRNGNEATSSHLKLYDPDLWWRTRLTDCQDHTIIGCMPNFNECHKMCYHPSHQPFHHFCWEIWTKKDIQCPSNSSPQRGKNHNPETNTNLNNVKKRLFTLWYLMICYILKLNLDLLAFISGHERRLTTICRSCHKCFGQGMN